MSIISNDDESVPLQIPKAISRAKSIYKKITDRFKLTTNRRGAAIRDKEKPLHNFYRFLGNRPFWGYHAFFAVLLAIIGSSTVLAKSDIKEDILYSADTTPVEIQAEFTAKVSDYTPVIAEDPASMVLAVAIEDTSGYYSEPLLTETKMTERPVEVVEEPREDLQNRSTSTKYTVKDGDTLSKIGLKYGITVATIQYQNNLKSETITPGQTLTLPAGNISASVIASANNKNTSSNSYSTTSTNDNNTEEGFVRPMAGTITRRISSGHTGTDISAAPGTAIVAARSGTVTQAAYGWNGGYGNIITIDHGGGVKTRYAHMQSFSVSVGQSVSAGQYIGACGNTGRVYGESGGYHLHFEAIVGGRFTAPF